MYFSKTMSSEKEEVAVDVVLLLFANGKQLWLQGYKTFFMLNSVEHEILNAHKQKNIKKFDTFMLRSA